MKEKQIEVKTSHKSQHKKWIVDTFEVEMKIEKKKKAKKKIKYTDKMNQKRKNKLWNLPWYSTNTKNKLAKQQYNEYWINIDGPRKNRNINNLNFWISLDKMWYIFIIYWLLLFNIHLIGIAFYWHLAVYYIMQHITFVMYIIWNLLCDSNLNQICKLFYLY